MVSRRAKKTPDKPNEPNPEDLTKDSRVQPGKGKGKDGQAVIHGTLSTLVREQILKDQLDRQKRARDVIVVNGRGGKDLEIFAKDISQGYEQTKKDRLLDIKPREIKDAKVLLRKVNENETY